MKYRDPLRRALHVAFTVAMWLLLVSGVTSFAFFFIMTPTRWNYDIASDLIIWRNSLLLQYNFANATTGKATPLLSSTYSFVLIWQWCGTLAAALGSAGLLWAQSPVNDAQATTAVPAAANGRQPTVAHGRTVRRRGRRSMVIFISKAAARLRRLLRWQVPPRGLWRALLGPDGLSLLDLLLVGLWLGLHAMWLSDMTLRALASRRAPPAAAVAKATAVAAATNNATLAPAAAVTNLSSAAVNATRSARLRHLLAVTNGTANSSISAANTTKMASTNATTKATKSTLKPLPREVQGSIARWTGFVGNLDMLLLFFPLPRCNFLHWLLGSDFPALLKYHRWLGHGTLAMYSIHGILYMSIWTADGVFSSNMVWSMGSYVNNVAGLVSMCSGWVLWLTSMPLVRRHLFNLFYVSHLGGTAVFMLFAFMHRKDVAPWVMPGVFLYLLDVVLRTIQQAFNSTRVCIVTASSTAATAVGSSSSASGAAAAVASLSPHASVLTLTIRCDGAALCWSGLDIVFLNIPAVSWWQWHPFTLATSSAAGGPETKMVLHIKTYNHWTQRLVSRLASDPAPIKLYVSGPYHGAHRKWISNFDRHIFVAGGIGITPALGMLQDLIARRRRKAAAAASNPSSSSGASAPQPPQQPPGGRVSLIWISRSRDELCALPYDVLQEASRTGPDAWLDMKLYLTGEEEEAEQESVPRTITRSSSNAGVGVTLPVGFCLDTGKGDKVAALNLGGGCHNITRPLAHPYMFSPLLWMAAVVLCFGGGLAGLICAQAYDAHIARTVAVRNDYTHAGVLQFVAMGLGSTLPPAVLMLVAHVIRRWQSRRSKTAAAALCQQQQCCKLYDKEVYGDCRIGSALHARMSVASTEHFPSDDTAAEQNPCSYLYGTDITNSCSSCHHLPAVKAAADARTSKPVRAVGSGSPTTTMYDSGNNCIITTEPFLQYGRPDLTAMLETVAKFGSVETTAAAAHILRPPPSRVTVQVETALPVATTPADIAAITTATANKVQPTVRVATPTVAAVADQVPENLFQQGSAEDLDLDPSELRVAVFVAGPVSLVEAVEERCAALNGPPWGRAGRAYLEVHPLTHEL